MASDSPIRLVVFDCDGTLIDGQHAIQAAMAAAFREHGLECPEPGVVSRVVGLPLLDAIARLTPGTEMSQCERLAESYKAAFHLLRQDPNHHEPIFEGAARALETLLHSGFVLGVATGKSRRGLKAALERHGIDRHFSVLKTSDDGPGKPDPHMLISAMSDMGVSPGSTVMIGDTVFDVAMARSARVAALGVEWGYHDRAELEAAGAVAVAKSFAEIPEMVERLIGRP
jgi:phosphoglycolate phosphatase